MRFPRTIRLDSSDEAVFERAAAPGEWAVSGAFAFADAEPDGIAGKLRQAFANGFLGTTSFGWSTLVQVATIREAEYEAVVNALAAHFVGCYGAPSLAEALPAARAEAEFAAGLCEHRVGTLLSVERDFGNDGIAERFRTVVSPQAPDHAKIWTIIDDDDGG